jgi:AAA+ ATPase superfamily predicted ATPase
MLFDRESELEELDFVLKESGSHLLMVSGLRRLGKTTLLVDWAQRADVPAICWVASRVSAVQLLRSFSQAVYNHLHPDMQVDANFSYPTREMVLRQMADLADQG